MLLIQEKSDIISHFLKLTIEKTLKLYKVPVIAYDSVNQAKILRKVTFNTLKN